jgi:hypothetical protein
MLKPDRLISADTACTVEGVQERARRPKLLEAYGGSGGRGLGRRQPWRGDDGGRPVRGGGRCLVPHATRAVGIPAVVPRRDVPFVGDVHEHSCQELQWVGGLGAGGGARDLAEKAATVETVGAEPLGVSARAEVAALAGKGQ